MFTRMYDAFWLFTALPNPSVSSPNYKFSPRNMSFCFVLFCNPLSLTKTFRVTMAWEPGAFTGGCTTEGKTQTTPDSIGNKEFNSEE